MKAFSSFDRGTQQLVIKQKNSCEGVICFDCCDYEYYSHPMIINGKKNIFTYVFNLIKANEVSCIYVDYL